MFFSPSSFPGRAVLVQGHVVEASRVRVLVQSGRVGVVPVLLKLLPEHTFSRQLLLQDRKQHISHVDTDHSKEKGQNIRRHQSQLGPR